MIFLETVRGDGGTGCDGDACASRWEILVVQQGLRHLGRGPDARPKLDERKRDDPKQGADEAAQGGRPARIETLVHLGERRRR